MMLTFGLFIAAASLGAAIRFGAGLVIPSPWSTLLINLIGSTLIGFLFFALKNYPMGLRIVVMAAFLGSLTTFSTYALEVVQYLEEGLLAKALLYWFASSGLCVLGCYLGLKLAQNSLLSL